MSTLSAGVAALPPNAAVTPASPLPREGVVISMSRPTMPPMISIEEEDALKRILAHHSALDPQLLKDLSTLLQWVHQLEQAKSSFGERSRPMPMLSLLGSIGIFGGEAIGPSPSVDK
jgi:hypothetical protein